MLDHPKVVALKRWLRTPLPDPPSLTYHTGFLAQDRVSLIAGIAYLPVQPLDTMATLLLEAEAEGRVVLVQRKLGNAKYEYIAQRKITKETDA